MRVFLCFDDTDTKDSDRGTGRLARLFEPSLPSGFELAGIVRQQLPRLTGIPFTSNNSSACLVLEADPNSPTEVLISAASAHIKEHFVNGSDPGLCVVTEEQRSVLDRLVDFARRASNEIVTRDDAHHAARGGHLSGHGGTNDGVIGAAAGVGLTWDGWHGRFIQWARIDLRALPDPVEVAALETAGIRVLGVDRDSLMPALEHRVVTHGWVRPRLWSGAPVLAVSRVGDTLWKIVGMKRDSCI